MNLILLDAHDRLDEKRAVITGRSLRHARLVLKTEPGLRLRVGFTGGLMGAALVTHDHGDRLEIELEELSAPPPALPLTLYLALPRPKSLPRILQTVTSLGVKSIHLMNAYQVEKSFWQSDYLAPASVDLALRLGLEQSRDTILPQVFFHRLLKPFVQDEVPTLVDGASAFIAHPVFASAPASACPSSVVGPCALAVGPEGGFIP
jgi:16S rRNA (uracil1498-N3)-methyltransferase